MVLKKFGVCRLADLIALRSSENGTPQVGPPCFVEPRSFGILHRKHALPLKRLANGAPCNRVDAEITRNFLFSQRVGERGQPSRGVVRFCGQARERIMQYIVEKRWRQISVDPTTATQM